MKDISESDIRANLPLTAKKTPDHKTCIPIGDSSIGGHEVTIIAGPCAVENLDQVIDIAKQVKKAGAHMLRGGAFKPLTFPYRSDKMFELREEGLKILAEARRVVGLPVVTEVMEQKYVAPVAECADVLQIGARNMQNFPLLIEVAKAGKPVLLKRHFGCSLRDWLGAAEYILANGNPHVILCERGIVAPHTHQPTSRFIVDLQVVPAAHEYTHLPVIVDASHSTFKRSYVSPVARAAVAIGADGVMVDVHPHPEEAAVDPLQALDYPAFSHLANDLREIAKISRHPRGEALP